MFKEKRETGAVSNSLADSVFPSASRSEPPEQTHDAPSQPRSNHPFDFNRWYGEYRHLVRGTVARMIKDPDTREDICQDIWARIAKVGHRYDPSRAAETSFISIIARRTVVDYLRREARHGGKISLAAFDPPDVGNGPRDEPLGLNSNPLAQALFEDNRQVMRERLAKLHPRQREIIEARFAHGRSLTQLARDFGIPLGTVKSLLCRTMRKLRRDSDGPG